MPERVLVTYFYAHPVGVAVEALHYCLGRHLADPTGEVAVALSAARLRRQSPPGTLHGMVLPDSAISQLRRGVLEFCVLAVLRDGERYGFELVRTLADGGGLVTTEGTLYPLLARLRRDGVVETTWRESPSGPPRRYYRLTPAGHEALSAFSAEWARFRTSVDAMLDTGAAP
jgi:PadR family transcriptional regulator